MKATFFKQSLIVTMLMVFIVACSKDDNNPMPEPQADTKETLLSRQLTNKDIIDFLDSYYTTYTFGDTEETTVGNDIYEVTEIFKNSSLPVGYVVSEKTTEDFLYFAHFDRDNETVDSYDIKTSENVYVSNLFEDENGKTVMDYDILDYISGTPSTEGKFWGTKCTTHFYPNGQSYQWCCYYVLWINTGCDYGL